MKNFGNIVLLFRLMRLMLSILYCERDFLLDVGLRIFSHKIELFHFFQAFASLASQ